MEGLGLTKVSTMGPIAAAIEMSGNSVQRVLRRAEMPASLMGIPDRLMLLRDQMRVVEGAVMEIGDASLPARLSTQAGIAGLGAIGRHVRASATLGEAITRTEMVTPLLLQTATQTGLRIKGQEASYIYGVMERIESGRQTNEILALGYLLGTMRQFLGPNWQPSRAVVTGATLLGRADIEHVFQSDLALGPLAGIVFPAAILDTPNPSRQELLDDETSPSAFLASDLVSCVSHLIVSSIGENRSLIDWVARRFGISRRTLQRRLEAEGTSFVEIHRAVLISQAKGLLAGDLSLGQIGYALGYSDPAHFTRAFIDWTGLTPRKWRRLSAAKRTATLR